LRLAPNLFHAGILGIFLGHFVGMLTPHWMYEPISTAALQQKPATVAGGTCGVTTLIGGGPLRKRRLTNRRVRATSPAGGLRTITRLVVQGSGGLGTTPCC
ncbi:respiratory nitrate reductase subunit gamma, partial [Morganella morganii]|uniref:respiratory nitrate reductase subunit gamma n=1 Tax=Morganella morganii TaxID=582 RepID=UPI0015F6CE44